MPRRPSGYEIHRNLPGPQPKGKFKKAPGMILLPGDGLHYYTVQQRPGPKNYFAVQQPRLNRTLSL